jgi:hypothetical protein
LRRASSPRSRQTPPASSPTAAKRAVWTPTWRHVPLHHQVIVWAMRESLDVPVFPFNLALFREARLK